MTYINDNIRSISLDILRIDHKESLVSLFKTILLNYFTFSKNIVYKLLKLIKNNYRDLKVAPTTTRNGHISFLCIPYKSAGTKERRIDYIRTYFYPIYDHCSIKQSNYWDFYN